ncbi:chaperone modulator CbpM [Apibacter sp.]|uniref:chaperone modulator CbpM n=1 Tax=Apibacter sp. TaxID=2023709 RepID=UPI0025EC2B32|nr:chaperone modulator CbpM [Apibacter sp.]MCT6869966.1 chaperone modulator CbpM [Apibacter sp.]
MKNDLITIEEYSSHYKVDLSFIEELENLGLIRIIQKEQKKYIPFDILSEVESYARMFYEMDINIAGIDAIQNLLIRIRKLQGEMTELKNRLRFYE